MNSYRRRPSRRPGGTTTTRRTTTPRRPTATRREPPAAILERLARGDPATLSALRAAIRSGRLFTLRVEPAAGPKQAGTSSSPGTPFLLPGPESQPLFPVSHCRDSFRVEFRF